MDNIWTAERIERLTELNAQGYSYQAIAIELACGITRNAVCGKIFRMKMPHPPSKEPCIKRQKKEPSQRGRLFNYTQADLDLEAARQKEAKAARGPPRRRTSSNYDILANIAIAASEPGIPEQLKGEDPDGTGIKHSDLTDFTCRWPRGDPKEPNFEFCGAKAVPGLPYCARHCALAYTPTQSRNRTDDALST